MTKKESNKADQDLQQHIAELTQDLQRVQADFINYRNRIEDEKKQVAEAARTASINTLLPIIDTIDRAISHAPEDLASHAWVKGIVGLGKNLEKSLADLGLERIVATPGTSFDPHLHEAVSVDDGEGDQEVVTEELRAGYLLNGHVVRPSMVKVGRK